MKRADFLESPSGKLVSTVEGQWAFVPHPLPPQDLDLARLANMIARVSQLLGELNGISRTLPDPYLLIRPLQVREALTSSSMEGTFTTLDDLLLLEAGAEERGGVGDTREVRNYRRALSTAIGSLDRVPLCLRTLRDAHRDLLSGVARHRGSRAAPGELKRNQNFIGAYEIANARYVPPPPREAQAALEALELYIQREERGPIPDIVDAALIHYQFEAIHPFSDGNGRVGRMLITLHLFMRQVIRQPILYLSPVFERRKDEYIDRMYDVSRTGAWYAWVAFFLEVVAEACEATIATADALLALQAEYRTRIRAVGRSANLVAVLDLLFLRQVVTIPQVAEYLQVQYRSAQLNVEALVRAGILHEVTDTANPKFFIARGIRDLIDQPPNRGA
ncbi:Fic family protein [Methylobacterium sp. J-088]|uniref:Fic family protein n=1 Tax=Methylobacterium sp. J-088 TaxID=2836664 RepID=UPI001FBACB88|nr:Fic/DOC family N-terminal domain-containing protein [Methylobacterium sp. J-088]MCJ2061372.1 Fic family protein [Methylobacterium sp. J-088]